MVRLTGAAFKQAPFLPCVELMYLVQLLLPVVHDHPGYDRVMGELTERFGGVTAYSRAPAAGLWKNRSNDTERDELVVVEVMVQTLERAWWAAYRRQLEQELHQEEIIVRALPIEPL